jgi:hypothetical protein
MRNVLRTSAAAWLLGAAIWGQSAGAGRAQVSPWPAQVSPWIPPALQDTERLQSDLRTAQVQFENAQVRLTRADAGLKAGIVDNTQLHDAAAEVQKWRGVIEDLGIRVQRSQLYQSLGRPVDVKFQDATIGDAAQVLAQTSGLAIAVDPALQTAGRVTMTANKIPMVEVLRLLAQNTKAQVAPQPGAVGVLLRPVPTLEVDGQVREFPGSNPPWSPEWSEVGGPPQQTFAGGGFGGFQGGFGGGGSAGFGGGGVSGAAGGGVGGGVPGGPGFGGGRDPRGGNVGPGGGLMPGGPAGFAPGGVQPLGAPNFPQPEDSTLAITAVGPNRFIVASRVGRYQGAMGGRMSAPILLSLYEIEGGQMRLLSTRVHEPGPVPGRQMPGGGPFGPGPMPGAPGAGPRPGAPSGAPGTGPRRVPPAGRAPESRPGGQPAPRQEARPDGGQDQPAGPALPAPPVP